MRRQDDIPNIHLLIAENNINEIQKLLSDPTECKKVINVLDDKYKQSPLALACSLGREEIVDLLLVHGADVSIGGLRTRKGVLDNAKKYPQIAKKILSPIKKYVDAVQSFDKLTDPEKGKIALLAFGLADYYAQQEDQGQAQHYFQIAASLTGSVTKNPTATSVATQVQIQGPLNWRMFNYYFTNKKYELAMDYYQTATAKFATASKSNDSSNLFFETEMNFDSLVLFCALQEQTDIVKIDELLPRVFKNFMNETIKKSGIDAGIKRIFDFVADNVKSLNPYNTRAIIGFIDQYLNKFIENDALSVEQKIDIYPIVAENFSKFAFSFIKLDYLKDAEKFFILSNKYIENYNNLNIDNKATKIKLTTIYNINTENLNFIKANQNLTNLLASDDFMKKSKDTKFFIEFLRKEFLPILQKFPTMKLPFEGIGGLMQSYIRSDHAKDLLCIDNVQFNERFPKEKLRELIEVCDIFSKVIHNSNSSTDFKIFRDCLFSVIRKLILTDNKSIDPKEVTRAIFKLISHLLNCELAYLKTLNNQQQLAYGEIVTFLALDYFARSIFERQKKFQGNNQLALSEGFQLAYPFYKQCYQQIFPLCPNKQLSYLTLTVLCLTFQQAKEYDSSIKFALMSIEEALRKIETSPHASSHLVTCVGVLSDISDAAVFPKYDETCVHVLDDLMRNLQLGLSSVNKSNLEKSAKQRAFGSSNNFCCKQAEKLIEVGMYNEAIHCILFSNINIVPFLDGSKQCTQFNLTKVAKLIDPLIQQLAAHPNKVDSSITTILNVVEHLINAKMMPEYNQVINLILENLSLFTKLNADKKLLDLLIGKIEGHEGLIDKNKDSSLVHLKVCYLKTLFNSPLDHSIVEKAELLLDDCQQFLALHTKNSTNMENVLLDANFKLGSWHAQNNQPKGALACYNNLIELCSRSNSPTPSNYLNAALIESNKIMLQMIEEFVEKNCQIEAITLCDEIIENLDFIGNESEKNIVSQKQIQLLHTLALQFVSDNKFSNALQLCEQISIKISKLPNGAAAQFYNVVDEIKAQAESGIRNQTEASLGQIKELIGSHSYKQAVQLCDKWIDKLQMITSDDKSAFLLKELFNLKVKAEQDEKDAGFAFGMTGSVSKAKHSTMFSKEPTQKAKTKGTAQPASNEEKKQLQSSKQINNNNNNNNNASEPINNNPQEKKIGKRVEAPFIKTGTANLFPVLMKDIPEFKALKKTNIVLYKELKRAVLEGGICKKIGESGIKYLGSGMWEAKVNSRSRLFGRTVTGDDGVNYIVFDTFSAKGLHRSK